MPTTHKFYVFLFIIIAFVIGNITSEGFSAVYGKMMFLFILMIVGIIPAGITYSYLDKKKIGNKNLKFLKYNIPVKLLVSPIVALFVLYPVIYIFSFAGIFTINDIIYSFVFVLIVLLVVAVSTVYYKNRR